MGTPVERPEAGDDRALDRSVEGRLLLRDVERRRETAAVAVRERERAAGELAAAPASQRARIVARGAEAAERIADLERRLERRRASAPCLDPGDGRDQRPVEPDLGRGLAPGPQLFLGEVAPRKRARLGVDGERFRLGPPFAVISAATREPEMGERGRDRRDRKSCPYSTGASSASQSPWLTNLVSFVPSCSARSA